MPYYCILFLIIYLLIHKLIHDLILRYSTQKLEYLHDEEDLYGSKLNEISRLNQKKYGSTWLIPVLFTIFYLSFVSYFELSLYESSRSIKILAISIVVILC